jgi:hypothetical protein
MLFKLLALPLTLPVAGIRFCLDQVLSAAEAELGDDGPVKEALLLLQLRLEEGEISEADYVREEAELLARLREVRDYRRRQAEAAGAAPGAGGTGATGERPRVVIEVADLPLGLDGGADSGPPEGPAGGGAGAGRGPERRSRGGPAGRAGARKRR